MQGGVSLLIAFVCHAVPEGLISTFSGCRFTWAVQYFVGAGFYVIPTYSPSDFSADNTVTSTPALFLRNWANLWAAITEVGAACFRFNLRLHGSILVPYHTGLEPNCPIPYRARPWRWS